MSKLAKSIGTIQKMNKPIPKGRAAKFRVPAGERAPKTYMLPKHKKFNMLPRVVHKM